MEFKEVVGRRRSIRFFEPDKPVEREKIQVILETARLASCAVNAHWLRAIVVDRDKIPPDKLNQLKTPVAVLTKQVFDVPDDWVSLWVMLVGYPAESWEAGGQRPRPPFEELYYEGDINTPFKRDPGVVEKLKASKMITAPAPLPGRRQEILQLADRLNLPM